jgi:hypothetical protein
LNFLWTHYFERLFSLRLVPTMSQASNQ